MHINPSISFALLALALMLWAGVGYSAFVISTAESSQASRALDLETEALQHETALQLHTLARETKEERVRLEEIAHASVIDILDAVEGAGRAVGITVTVGRALGTPAEGGVSDVYSATLAIEAGGTFAQVVRVASLLESLPVPSEVREVHFERQVGTSPEAPWRMVAEVRFLTTAEISS